MAAIEYGGVPGATQECIDAVVRLIQCRVDLRHARILSAKNNHALLLTTSIGDLIAVKSGFASGYLGEGSRGFSYVLQLLKDYETEIDECKVSEQLIDRLDYSALSARDIKLVNNARPLRPRRWHDYILEEHWRQAEEGTMWRDCPPLIPLALVRSTNCRPRKNVLDGS